MLCLFVRPWHLPWARYNLKIKPIVFALSLAISNSAFADDKSIELDPIAVTGNPLGVASDELVVPISVINGKELNARRASTLGETLNGIPGVSATQFGPNASRPVIRGLDAERVRILQNGIGILDASSLSFDHAVGVDPLIIEQIDVIRGPAALLYGGNAVGGVVNAIDHRIPKEQLNGVIGRAETSFGGPASTRSGAVVVDLGNDQFAVHVDVYNRKTNDLNIPGFAVSRRKNEADSTPRENKGTLVNSDAQNDGAAIGAALTFEQGYIGASIATMNSDYGVVAEEDVRINMKSDRLELASEFTELDSIFHRVKARMAHTDYEHVELEGNEVGTTFKNRGIEGSLEAGHQTIAGFDGVIGYQFSNTNFEALGEEAFVPDVNTQNQALYLYEELPINQHKITMGARTGRTEVNSKNSPGFSAGQDNNFNTTSLAFGGLYNINKQWSLASNLSHNERAPSYFELYADGEHVATGQFEVGDTNLKKERSNGVDAQLRWDNGQHKFSLGAYYTRFSNFIGLFDTGNIDDPSGLPITAFSEVPAVFQGLEAEGRFSLSDTLILKTSGDYVHAKDKETNDYLPRISPLRLGAGLEYEKNRLSARFDLLHAFKQNRTSQNELATDGYTNVTAIVSYRLPIKYNMAIYAKANNLLNEEIREHASFLKDIAPAGERSILVGARVDF